MERQGRPRWEEQRAWHLKVEVHQVLARLVLALEEARKHSLDAWRYQRRRQKSAWQSSALGPQLAQELRVVVSDRYATVLPDLGFEQVSHLG